MLRFLQRWFRRHPQAPPRPPVPRPDRPFASLAEEADARIWAALHRAGLVHHSETTAAWRTLNALDGQQLLLAEHAFRESGWEFTSRSMAGVLAANETVSEPDQAAAYRFAAASGADGFERQRALEVLGNPPRRLDLAAALIRSQDWVPQVRKAARDALWEMFWGRMEEQVFGLFDLLVLLRERERGRSEDAVDFCNQCLRGEQFRELRWQLTTHHAPRVRLAAFQLMLEADPECADEVLRRAGQDPSVRIALWALREASANCDAAMDALLDVADRHRHPAVRAESVRLRDLRHPDAARLHAAVFDPARSVRNAAAYLLRSRYDESAMPRWREALDNAVAPTRGIAAAAIAEHAEAVDLLRLERLLADPSPRLRSMALHSLVRLKSPKLPHILLSALDDPATRVRREAIRAYRIGDHALDPLVLEGVYLRATADSQRISLLHAVRALGKWDALALLLARAEDSEASRFLFLAPHLDRWRLHANSSYVPLPDARKVELLSALDRAAGEHPHYRWDALRAMV